MRNTKETVYSSTDERRRTRVYHHMYKLNTQVYEALSSINLLRLQARKSFQFVIKLTNPINFNRNFKVIYHIFLLQLFTIPDFKLYKLFYSLSKSLRFLNLLILFEKLIIILTSLLK